MSKKILLTVLLAAILMMLLSVAFTAYGEMPIELKMTDTSSAESTSAPSLTDASELAESGDASFTAKIFAAVLSVAIVVVALVAAVKKPKD